jgi:hypothetical protein
VAAGDAVLAAGDAVLAALVSCVLPPLLQPATAAAASAIAPMASFFLIVCSPSGPADLPVADPSRFGTMSDECLAFCAHLPRLGSGDDESRHHLLKQVRTG